MADITITINDIDQAIQKIFGEYRAFDVETTYEKEGDKYKLIIFFHKLYGEENSILYTKLIFLVDENKTKLEKNDFLYLYDINCKYRKVSFEDIDDFKNKINDIFSNEKFGDDIKILSKFMTYPATMINQWFYDNNITELHVSNFRYTPKIEMIPCKYLFFDFIIEIENIEVKLKITKEEKNEYKIEIVFPNKTERENKNNLNTLIQTIGLNLKNNIEK